jgi:RimJ/RimL family protein N-acetyltransferase
MTAFPIDRTHPPRQLVYRDEARQLVLRPWTLDDVDDLLAAVASSLAELRAFLPWAHQSLTRENQYRIVTHFHAEYWAGAQYVLGMFDRDGRVLGGVGLHARTPLNPRALEVGYWTRSSEAARGWATLAVQMSTVLAFDRLDCDRLQVTHDESNIASRRVIEKAGFVHEGVLRNATAHMDDSLRAGGYLGTGRQRLYALTPDDLDRLPWVPSVRAAMTLVDALGGRVAPPAINEQPETQPAPLR